MSGDVIKILVCRQHYQLVTQAELRQQRIDRANLKPGPPATVTQPGGIDVVLPIRDEERQRGEALENLLARLGSRKPLQQFLQHEPGGVNLFSGVERLRERFYRRLTRLVIASQGERPDARVDKKAHARERSFL